MTLRRLISYWLHYRAVIRDWWESSYEVQIVVMLMLILSIVLIVASTLTAITNKYNPAIPYIVQYPEQSLECVLVRNTIINCWKLEK